MFVSRVNKLVVARGCTLTERGAGMETEGAEAQAVMVLEESRRELSLREFTGRMKQSLVMEGERVEWERLVGSRASKVVGLVGK